MKSVKRRHQCRTNCHQNYGSRLWKPSHGDHYHYYNGKVPYDAIISEELLMKDPNYQLKDSDIVNEIKGGYVIKVDGKYYVLPKDTAFHADTTFEQRRNYSSETRTR